MGKEVGGGGSMLRVARAPWFQCGRKVCISKERSALHFDLLNGRKIYVAQVRE